MNCWLAMRTDSCQPAIALPRGLPTRLFLAPLSCWSDQLPHWNCLSITDEAASVLVPKQARDVGEKDDG
jgi:hypothetical protein